MLRAVPRKFVPRSAPQRPEPESELEDELSAGIDGQSLPEDTPEDTLPTLDERGTLTLPGLELPEPVVVEDAFLCSEEFLALPESVQEEILAGRKSVGASETQHSHEHAEGKKILERHERSVRRRPAVSSPSESEAFAPNPNLKSAHDTRF